MFLGIVCCQLVANLLPTCCQQFPQDSLVFPTSRLHPNCVQKHAPCSHVQAETQNVCIQTGNGAYCTIHIFTNLNKRISKAGLVQPPSMTRDCMVVKPVRDKNKMHAITWRAARYCSRPYCPSRTHFLRIGVSSRTIGDSPITPTLARVFPALYTNTEVAGETCAAHAKAMNTPGGHFALERHSWEGKQSARRTPSHRRSQAAATWTTQRTEDVTSPTHGSSQQVHTAGRFLPTTPFVHERDSESHRR